MTIRAGFIGLGMQGKPIAAHLAPAGFETIVYDVLEEPVQELAQAGARAATSPREVAQNADVIGICVPEDHHLLSVMHGPDGVLAGASKGTTVLVHSTVQPETILELASAASVQEIRVLDACVSGSATGAESKQLTYMIGCAESEIGEARAYLEATSDLEVLYCEEVGNGCRLKLALNTITYIQWAAAFESSRLAAASGLPQELLEKAGLSNGQLTPMMKAYLDVVNGPTSSEESQTFLRRNMLIGEKDLAWALALARKSGVSMPVASLVSQQLARIYCVEDSGRR